MKINPKWTSVVKDMPHQLQSKPNVPVGVGLGLVALSLILLYLNLTKVDSGSSITPNQPNNPSPTQATITPTPNPTSTSTVTPTASPTEIVSMYRSIVDLRQWKLTLPESDSNGNPVEILQPQLQNYSNQRFFYLDSAKQGLVFGANAGGATTKNSDYPRSELREMAAGGVTPARWSSSSGYHSMTITQAITSLPAVKPEIVAGQIHDSEDDVIMIRLERKRLFVEADGKDIGLLDDNYQLGTTFTVVIEATGGRIRVGYNNVAKVDYKFSGGGLYFKAGAYLQSNPDRGDLADAVGQVIIYKLNLIHR